MPPAPPREFLKAPDPSAPAAIGTLLSLTLSVARARRKYFLREPLLERFIFAHR
jgi:hypothetical protein